MKQPFYFTFPRLRVFLVASFSIAALVFSLSASANQLYRYKDEAGNTVLDRSIPPKFVKNGYDILNSKGRVIERIPPALTKAQIAARDAELERQKLQAEAEAEQMRKDNELRQLYSHPNDAVRILKRKTQDIKGVILYKETQIESTEKQIIQAEGKAAQIQRNGHAIPETLLASIQSMNKDIVTARTEIEELKENMAAVIAEFDEKIKRLEFITNKQATDYPTLLESLKLNKSEPAAAEVTTNATPANP